jgi:hypothetical protein
MASWEQPHGCDELDRWIDTHRDEIERAAFQLIANDRHYLYGES